MVIRRLSGLAVSLLFVLLGSPALAAGMCRTDGAASGALGRITASASAKFLEAASEAFLAFKAKEEASDALESHLRRVQTLLDEAARDYKASLERPADLAAADRFLRARPFRELRPLLGISPGTLNDKRWEILAKTARQSKTPAADFIKVCIAGAEQLKFVTATVRPATRALELRRVAYNWHLVLMHGALVSDAFDRAAGGVLTRPAAGASGAEGSATGEGRR